MVEMSERGLGGLSRIPPLPPFVTPEELVSDALPLLDPPSRITVTDAAERALYIPVQGNWRLYDRRIAPYTVEPQDMTQSRRFKGVVFMGPSQSGKTQMLISVVAHAVTSAPGPVQIVHMTKTDADVWVEEKLDPAIDHSPALRERLGRAREDSTFGRKRFKGVPLTIGYPVANQLSSRSRRVVLLTDYDHMPQILGPKDAGEGSPFGMALQRIRTYLSRGCVMAEGSPAFPVDPKKKDRAGLRAPHLMPPTTAGITLLYNQGTRGRWYWECPECHELFEPRFDRLSYDATLEPAEAGERATMVCPKCGCPLPHRLKTGLNRAALNGHGGWLHEGRSFDEEGRRRLVRIDDPDLRAAPYASYALNGAAAAFSSWSELVERYESARLSFEANDDATDLARVHYTDIGVPWEAPTAEDEEALSVADLAEHKVTALRGTAPSWTRFVTVSVDVQGNRFEVLAMAWGANGERMPIERFAIFQPPEDAPFARGSDGKFRAVDPGRYPEDAGALTDLADRVFPVEGADWGLMPVALAVDFNGPPGWSDNAEAFWRARAREGQGKRWFLSIGRPGFGQRDRVWYEAPGSGSRGRKARRIRLLNMATDRLKDSVLAALGRFGTRKGAQHVPEWMEEPHLAELLAEEKGPKGYVPKPGQKRNETLDHSVQALALAEFLGVNRVNWEAAPDWCLLGPGNAWAVQMPSADPEAGRAPARPEHRAPVTSIGWLRR